MSVKVIRIALIVFALVTLYFAIQIYYQINGGTPWGKASYKSEVTRYLNSKYPDLDYSVEFVYYSVKEMHYSAIVKTSETDFSVKEREKYGLWDNFPHSLWVLKAGKVCNETLVKHTNEASCKVELAGSGGLNEFEQPFPSYEQVREQLHSYMKTFVSFNRELSGEDYKLILEIAESINGLKISKNIDFIYADASFFDVSESETPASLKKKEYRTQEQ